MRKEENLSLDNMEIGLRVKVRLPRSWAQVPRHKPHAKGPYCYVKGVITEINKNSVTINTRYNYGHCCTRKFLENLWCCANKETGKFDGIYLIY